MAELEEEVKKINFFQDFLSFLRYLEIQPVSRTAKGNISRKDIEVFSQTLTCVKKVADEYSEYGWKIVGDWQLRDLDKIRVLAEAMYLTYKRQGQIRLSRNGKGYLSIHHPLIQYQNMVLHYWERIDWEYFEHGPLDLIQKNQNIIWTGLLENGEDWINFTKFAEEIEKRFNLQSYFSPKEWNPGKPNYSVIEYGLIRHNLELFGLVETAGKVKWKDYQKLEKLRPTKLGLYIFKQELEEPLYSGGRPIVNLWKN